VVAGATSETFGAPFFQAADFGRPLGVLFLDRPLGRNIRLFSRNVLGNSPTLINGLAWNPRPGIDLTVGGGLGAGKRYAASSVTVQRAWLRAQAGYVDTTRLFRTIAVDSPGTADTVRENVSLALQPHTRWSVHAARRHLAEPGPTSTSDTPITVHHLGGLLNIASLRVGGGIFTTRAERFRSAGTSLNVGRQLGDRTDVHVSFFRNNSTNGGDSRSVTGTVRRVLNPRMTLAGFLVRTDGQTTTKPGGEFVSNLLTLGVDYQTVHAPFRSGGPLVQALALHGSVQPFGSIRLHVATVTTLSGDIRYTISGSRQFYRSRRSEGGHGTSRIAKYLVRGRITDEAGRPVAGAVVRIGPELILSDDDGRFFLRTASARPLPMAVLTEQFRATGRFTVLSAPLQATPTPDVRATDVSIRVSRSQ
jgi:hypothetical protein